MWQIKCIKRVYIFYLYFDYEEVFILSALQNQVVQSLDGLSDDSLEFILDMIQRFVKPAENQLTGTIIQKKGRKLGVLKGQTLIADGYDLDECNDEIAEMFGVDK